jgi:hypothetical protein
MIILALGFVFFGLSAGQCCQALANGFCPFGSGGSSGSQCESCASVSTSSCQCGGGSCFSSLSACNSACVVSTSTNSAPTTPPASSGSYYSVYYDGNICQAACEMNAPASASLAGNQLTVNFQGGLGATCNGLAISRAISSIVLTNVAALAGSVGFYQGQRGGSLYCFYLDSRILALPQQPGACPPGPPFRDSCSVSSGGVVNLIDVLSFGNPVPSPLPVVLPSGTWGASLTIPIVTGGSCSACSVTQSVTIATTGANSLLLSAGTVTSNPCNVPPSGYPSFSFSITNIVTRESAGYFFGTSSTGSTVCFIYLTNVFVFGFQSCPTGPLRQYCGPGAASGSIVVYAFAQDGPLPTGPPLTSSSTTTATTSPSQPSSSSLLCAFLGWIPVLFCIIAFF